MTTTQLVFGLCYYVVAKQKDTHFIDYEIWLHGQDAATRDKPVLTGSVKWDGCSNWGDGNFCAHACTRQQVADLGAAMALCWDHAAATIKTWDGELT